VDEGTRCIDCGCCCLSDFPEAVRVTGNDYERLGSAAPRLVHFTGNRAFMRIQEGHCAALVVDRARRQFRCEVYETRPQVCRNLAQFSAECRAEYESKARRRLPLLGAVPRDEH
jgi:uncharacterized protein